MGIMASLKDIKETGLHILVDFFGVNAKMLRNREKIMLILRKALKKAGFKVIQEAGGHTFRSGGKGVTGFILLAQSHAAFHSYPEYNYMALDIYSCGGYDTKPIVKVIEDYLKPKKVVFFYCKRGSV
jgi:S-adenosylmethionine decarboxylase